jgi:hypothetical protein
VGKDYVPLVSTQALPIQQDFECHVVIGWVVQLYVECNSLTDTTGEVDYGLAFGAIYFKLDGIPEIILTLRVSEGNLPHVLPTEHGHHTQLVYLLLASTYGHGTPPNRID